MSRSVISSRVVSGQWKVPPDRLLPPSRPEHSGVAQGRLLPPSRPGHSEALRECSDEKLVEVFLWGPGDMVYGPIFESLMAGNSVDNFSIGAPPLERLLEHTPTGTRRCVPTSLISDVISAHHAVGHPSEQKLVSLMLRRYIFSVSMAELRRISHEFIRTCQICQAVKPRTGRQPNTLDFFPIPDDIFT